MTEELNLANPTLLKSCPFCGGRASYMDGDWNTSMSYIECANDECSIQPSGAYCRTELEVKEAIEAWNNRV